MNSAARGVGGREKVSFWKRGSKTLNFVCEARATNRIVRFRKIRERVCAARVRVTFCAVGCKPDVQM